MGENEIAIDTICISYLILLIPSNIFISNRLCQLPFKSTTFYLSQLPFKVNYCIFFCLE